MERVLTGSPVSVPAAFSKANESAFRNYIENELADTYRKSANIVLPFGYTLGFTGANGESITFELDGSGNFNLLVDGTAVFTVSSDSATLALDNDGRVVGLKVSGGATTEINMIADIFNFYDGETDRPLITAAGGRFTVNGDLEVTGSFTLGGVRVPVSPQARTFYKADGEAVEWAGGEALNTVPDVTIIPPGGVALAAGEALEPPTITGATTIGGTLRLKISTPGATSTVTDSTDSAGGTGEPDRVMAKGDTADAYNAIYNFRIQGSLHIRSVYDPETALYVNDGTAEISTWFDDGGGFDEGPTVYIAPWDAGVAATTASSMTGDYAYDVTTPVLWANAIGAGGTYAYGVTLESGLIGTTLTDLTSVSYTKQSASGTRTGSPNGEVATIIVQPKNQ